MPTGNEITKFNCPDNQLTYIRQPKCCIKVLKRWKKYFYNNLSVKRVADNKHFWKPIKPKATDKILRHEKIILVEGDKAETDLAKTFKDHFENIVESLHIDRFSKIDLDRKPVVNAIKNFSQHPSILLIKEIRIYLVVSLFTQ